MEFGLYPPHWWKIWPQWVIFPADEDGPAQLVVSFSLFQMRKYVWRVGK